MTRYGAIGFIAEWWLTEGKRYGLTAEGLAAGIASDPGTRQTEPQEAEQAETKQKEKAGEDV
jgi:hypothetical protein